MTAAVDAIVVGGGFAGVTAARELRHAGLSTVLLEARDRLGGRTWTDDFGGEPVDLGGGWVHWRQPHLWAEMTRYGIGIHEDSWTYDRVLLGDPLQAHDPDEAFTRMRELFTLYGGDTAEAFSQPFDPLRLSSEVTALDELSLQARLDQLDIPESDRELLTGLLFEIAGSPLDEAGALQLLRWLALCDGNVDRWYDTNKFRPVGGTVALIDSIVADAAAEVRLSSPVASLSNGPDGVRAVTRGGETVEAAVAVVAVPVNTWPAIEFTPGLPATHAEAAAIGWGKPHQDKVWMRVRGPIGRVFAQLPAPAPLNFFWTLRVDEDSQLMVGINASPELDVTDKDQVERTIRSYVPEIEEVLDVRGQAWAADEFSAGGNTCSRPGEVTRRLADLQRPWNRVAFATTDIANGWVGYMDGAIESGIRAARQCREIAGS